MKKMLLLFLLTLAIYPQESKFQFLEPVVKESDAFTMIGDSRTQYIFQVGIASDWEDFAFLGKFKSDCSAGKTGVQNAGFAGSTTEHWLQFFKGDTYKPEQFHERIVIMIGGNDILRNAYRWKSVFSGTDVEELNVAIDEIHSRVIEMVDILKSSNKKIILQTHFRVSPFKHNANTIALNDGLDALNVKLIETYGAKKDPDVSIAEIHPDFPGPFFLDLVHLNQFGFQYHSHFLSKELQNRCWW